MKYIIDIPNADVSRWVAETPLGKKLYIPISVEDGHEYSIATEIYAEEYTEPDRKAIEDEVWNLARDIAYCMSLDECEDAGMLCKEDIYDSATGVLEKLTYQEAKEKYEAWKKQKDEIRVGDEVVYADDPNKEKAIVLRLYQPKQYGTLADILCEDGIVVKMIKVENLAWTGRHFDEVEDMLKKMKGA